MLSSAVRRSNSQAPRAEAMNARCVWHTPFGLPVVPDVYSMTDTSSSAPLATSPSKKPGLRGVELAADLLQPLVAGHALVVAQPAGVVVVDVLERGDVGLRLQHLVDLLLVLDDGVGDAGVLQHEGELGRRRVLVHRHRHAAQALHGGHRPVQPRPVVADDREVVAALEALRGQAAGERADLVGHLPPGPGLPDAEILLAHGGMLAAHRCVVQHETRKRRQCRGIDRHPGSSSMRRRRALGGRGPASVLRPLSGRM